MSAMHKVKRGDKMKIRSLKTLVLAILFPLSAGLLSSLFTIENMNIYDRIYKPSIAPPGIVFPIVWTLLFILMGIASYFVYLSESPYRENALKAYGIQLIINFLFNIIFFNLNEFFFAFLWTILLLFVNIIMIQLFYRCDKRAGYLLIPYILWDAFAILLSFCVYALNR